MKTLAPGFWLVPFCFMVCGLSAQVPSMPIASVRFEGNEKIDARQLKSLLWMSREGEIFVAENLEADLLRVEKAYQDQGFLRVQVGPPEIEIQTHENRKTVLVRIPVSEGSVYRVGEVAIKNAQVISAEAFMQMCPLKKGEAYSRTKAMQWQAKIEDTYRSMGYIKYRGIARENLNEIQKVVDLSLECVEGKPYSVGKIILQGDDSIDSADFKRRLLFSEGGLFNPEMLAISIQFLNQTGLYGQISYSDVDIRIDEAKNTVDVTLHLVRAK